MGVISFTLRPLYTREKSPRYPLERRVGRFQSRSGSGGEEENSQPLPGIEPGGPVHNLQAKFNTNYKDTFSPCGDRGIR